MLLDQETSGGAVVVAVRGEVRPAEVSALAEAVEQARRGAASGVVVDLTAVTSLSPGAGPLLASLLEHSPCWPHPCVLLAGGCQPGSHPDRATALGHVDDRCDAPHRRQALPSDPLTPRRARQLAVTWLATTPHGALADDLALVVSELVTNAVRHAQPPLELELVDATDAVVVAVQDGAAAAPARREAGHDAEGGRGMDLVAQLSRTTGVRPHAGGKTVWAELSARA